MDEARTCLKHDDVDALQIIFNIFRQKPIDELFAEAKAKGVAIIVRLPLASGLLAGKYTKATTFPEKDHRNYNRDGKFFNVGETFAGIPFEKAVQLATAIKPFLGISPTSADATQSCRRAHGRPGDPVDSRPRCGDHGDPRRHQAPAGPSNVHAHRTSRRWRHRSTRPCATSTPSRWHRTSAGRIQRGESITVGIIQGCRDAVIGKWEMGIGKWCIVQRASELPITVPQDSRQLLSRQC